MTKDEAMRIALEALVNNRYIIESEINLPEALEEVDVAIAVLRQALEQPSDIEAAVRAENEACAKVCESMRPSKEEYDQQFYTACTLCANAIRARGE